MSAVRLPNVLLIGTGEYTTGYVHGAASTSDKPIGVVAITFFALRARGKVGSKIGLCGTTGTKAPFLRQHLKESIENVYNLDATVQTYPQDNIESDHLAYEKALNDFEKNDIAVITTPDNTHATIAAACIKRGLHVMLAKPVVQSLSEHLSLNQLAQEHNVLVIGEFHKRFDPLYSDAIARIQFNQIGTLNYFNSYMSQPKSQLKTFSKWLTGNTKKAPTDISYYLNAHHIDFLNVAIDATARPTIVYGMAAQGTANQELAEITQTSQSSSSTSVTTPAPSSSSSEPKEEVAPEMPLVEDTISLMVQYENFSTSSTESKQGTTVLSRGMAHFTSSWIAEKSDVHSQQRCFFLGSKGEINIDQAHRGYAMASHNSNGLRSLNPLFMRYIQAATSNNNSQLTNKNDSVKLSSFVGENGYGFASFENFVDAVSAHTQSLPAPVFCTPLAFLSSRASLCTTAILEAGRKSLDEGGRGVKIVYDEKDLPVSLQ